MLSVVNARQVFVFRFRKEKIPLPSPKGEGKRRGEPNIRSQPSVPPEKP